jgi:hypothetical protein
MTYFPGNVFSLIIEFCDDAIERKQKYLWNSIKVADVASDIKPQVFIEGDKVYARQTQRTICRVAFVDKIRGSMNFIYYPDYEKYGVEGIMRKNFIGDERRIDNWWYDFKTYSFMYRFNKNHEQIEEGMW